MTDFIVDASVAVKWVIAEAEADRAVALRRFRLAAPDLIIAEVGNVLWKKVRRQEITAEVAILAARAMELVEIELVPMRALLAKAARCALALNHPVYDCLYVCLADDRGIPFVTADARLRQKLSISAYEVAADANVLSLEQAARRDAG